MISQIFCFSITLRIIYELLSSWIFIMITNCNAVMIEQTPDTYFVSNNDIALKITHFITFKMEVVSDYSYCLLLHKLDTSVMLKSFIDEELLTSFIDADLLKSFIDSELLKSFIDEE